MKFCKDCVSYYNTGRTKQCDYPDNIKTKYDWECEWTVHIQPPHKINKTNNCKWFERK